MLSVQLLLAGESPLALFLIYLVLLLELLLECWMIRCFDKSMSRNYHINLDLNGTSMGTNFD